MNAENNNLITNTNDEENSTHLKAFLKGLAQDLLSTDENKVLTALKTVRSKGTSEIIPVLLDAFEKNENQGIKSEIKLILEELKITDAIAPLTHNLNLRSEACQEAVLSAIWNANLNCSNHLGIITKSACNGSYLGAIEALTIFENAEGPFNEEQIQEAKLELNEYFNNKSDHKEDIIKQLLHCIRLMEESLQA